MLIDVGKCLLTEKSPVHDVSESKQLFAFSPNVCFKYVMPFPFDDVRTPIKVNIFTLRTSSLVYMVYKWPFRDMVHIKLSNKDIS